jgi:hypothetical protein
MWPFGKRARLLRQLDSLAIYNDKGIAWARHSEHQTTVERERRIQLIKRAVAQLSPASLPSQFITDLRAGLVAQDGTGRYVDLVRAHFRAKHGGAL